MFLLEVVLEGFKSYAVRTVVPNFDPEFNAITGLNGSGKSNILDSICFVLGISNLSQVRARGCRGHLVLARTVTAGWRAVWRRCGRATYRSWCTSKARRACRRLPSLWFSTMRTPRIARWGTNSTTSSPSPARS
jgi:hypothetical protein